MGGTALTIERVQMPAAPFGVTGPPREGAQLKPGESITITVTFQPTEAGSFKSQIGLQTSAGTGTIGLTGTAAAPGDLKFSTEDLEYGEVLLGSGVSKTFKIENVGGASVELTKSKPPIGGEFAATTELDEGTTIEPGASVSETVAFTPTALGPAEGEWPINGKDISGLHVIHFNGYGASPLTGPISGGGSGSLTGGGSGGAGAMSASPPPEVTLTSLKLTASRFGTVAAALHCPKVSGRCMGTITLRATTRIPGRRPSSPWRVVSLVIAAGSFTIEGGHTKVVDLRLSRHGRELVAHKSPLRSPATISARDPAGVSRTVHETATLRLRP